MDINIPEKLDQETIKRIKTYPHPLNRASEAGHPCARYLVLLRLAPEKRLLPSLELQRIFDEGNLHERAVLREIEEAGFRLKEQQRHYEWKRFELTGRIDGKVANNGSAIFYPLEIKSCSPNVFMAIRDLSPAEMIKSKYSWVRRYPAQILLYCMMEGVEEGIIVFKNKVTGEKIQKNFCVNDHLDYLEEILKKLELVNDYVARGELPPIERREECDGCEFTSTACFPGRDYGPGYEFLSDAELEAKLLRWEETKEAAREHEELDKELKDIFKGKSAIIGDFKITSKEFERVNYNIPIEIKKQYAEKTAYWRTTIEKLGDKNGGG